MRFLRRLISILFALFQPKPMPIPPLYREAFPTVGANADYDGDGAPGDAWVEPGRIVADDDSYTGVTSNNTSKYLSASGFDFVLTGGTITRLKAIVNAYSTANLDYLRYLRFAIFYQGVRISTDPEITLNFTPPPIRAPQSAYATLGLAPIATYSFDGTLSQWGIASLPIEALADPTLELRAVWGTLGLANESIYINYMKLGVTWQPTSVVRTCGDGGAAVQVARSDCFKSDLTRSDALLPISTAAPHPLMWGDGESRTPTPWSDL